ncbi:MobF family relaxase [Frankia sp. AgB32]|uniref:MobF family relaxase n=1 Tax=Frankia sp. AgB32 TaxID=631119 RepID=UPI00200EF669|nr:MobF family relaxase [Frankia sp. AgB32]MCK9895046.1 relaxase domain-containing protein [Frankia sp. AgB32]
MITTVKVLTLRARDAAAVARAARAVVAYVEGGQPTSMAPLRRYYGEGLAPGRARGSAAYLVGLAADRPVSEVALERLLSGDHAVTGRPLLSGSGSAGRAASAGQRRPAGGAGDGMLTLEEAARRAGVSASYLRELAARTEAAAGAKPADTTGAAAASSAQGPRLAATREEATGRWLVSVAEVDRFCADRLPPAVVLGFDVTCSAPKSVSLLWAFGDEEIRRDVAAAMNVGVDAVLAYLERHGVVGTVGGHNRPGLGLAAASYLHEVSRSDEAHLHVHSIVVNATAVAETDEQGRPVMDERGRPRVDWRALDGEVFLAQVKTAGYVGAAALRHELTRRRGVRWGPVRNGVAELAGFPPELLGAFSTRHGEVQAEYAQLVADGLTPGGVTATAAQRGSRAAKKVLADAQVRRIQHEKLAAAGWTPDQVRRLAATDTRSGAPVRGAAIDGDELAELCLRLTGPTGLTEQTPTFDRQAVVRQVAAWSQDRLPGSEIDRLTDRVLADQRIVLLGRATPRARRDPEPVYTTQELLEVEDTLLALCRQGRVDAGAPPRLLVDSAVLEAHLGAARPPQPDGTAPATAGGGPGQRGGEAADPVVLTAEQINLVSRLLISGDLVRPVIGPAGSGKTEAMRLFTRIVRAAGGQVFATAHGGRQTEELVERIAVPGRVVSGWLTLLDHTDDLSRVWPAGSVLILDEATQVATRDAARLLRYAARTGTVLILLGDPAQLGAVGAGGWYAHLVAAAPDVPGLGALHRQAGAALAPVRAALGALRADTGASARRALDLLAADGRIRLFDSREALLAQVVDDWYAERAAHRATAGAARTPLGAASRMMAERTTRDVDLLACAARERLVADGTLTGPVLTVAGRDFQVGDEVITLTQAGHTLVPDGKPASAYIRTGTFGRIVDVHLDHDHPDRQAVTVRFAGKGTVRVPWDYLTHRFSDGRDGGLGHGYAITAAKAEGSSMPTARAVAPDDTSRAGLYVMLSRARTDLAAYIIRRADLEADLDEEDWLPVLRDPTGPLQRITEHLAQSRTERLASDHDHLAHAAHRLRRTHTLSDLARLPAGATPGATAGDADLGTPTSVDVAPAVHRRAELAAEAALAANAVANPPAGLVARIGPRPATGTDRARWDRTVGALAIHHARHQPPVPPQEPGPPPPPEEPAGTLRTRWILHHDQAVDLARSWADGLPNRTRARFHSQAEHVPRTRAIAGLHALLDHGHPPDDLLAALTSHEQSTARTGAAVLDHRVATLCKQQGLIPTDYLLPRPRPAREDWTELVGLLNTCEIHHQARRPTAHLAAERRRLLPTQTATLGRQGPDSDEIPEPAVGIRTDGRDELQLIEAALDQQIAHAVFRAGTDPADYLTGLLGTRPSNEPDAAAWDSRAETVEQFRHRHLGLPYGISATSDDDTNPRRQAIGEPPTDPSTATAYSRVLMLGPARTPALDL